MNRFLLIFILLSGLGAFTNRGLAQDCKMSNLIIEKSACTQEKTFYVTINFTYQGVSECFNLSGGGTKYGQFKYSQLPLKIGPLKGDCTTNYEFVVRDCAKEICSISGVLGKVCCETQACSISDLTLDRSDCNADGNFYVTLNFNHKNNSDCFYVQGNGVKYGVFKYAQLPLKIGPIKGDCTTSYEFAVIDCADSKCSTAQDLGIVCCEQSGDCKIYDAEISKSACDSAGQFYVKLNFKYKNTSDSFDVTNGKNKLYGRFAFAKLPVLIGPFAGDCSTKHVIEIIDYKNEKCHLEKEVGVVCCDSSCMLSELKMEKSNCDSDKKFYVYLNFGHKNTSDCFTVQGNGNNYGTFNYSQLPIKLGPLDGNCETSYEFVIRDCKSEKCALEGQLGKVCCEQSTECMLSDFSVQRTECNADGNFYVSVKFNFKNVSECFVLYQNDNLIGKFLYSKLPLVEIGPFKGDCQTNYVFSVRDCEKESCVARAELGKVCCSVNENCKLSDIKIEKTSCNSTKEFYAVINFNHSNTSDCFTLQGNGVNYGTFQYSQLPIKIGPLKGDCTTNYEFLIRDCKNEKCALEGVLGKVCCEQSSDCMLSDLTVIRSDCNADGNFFIKVAFNFKNVSDCFVLYQNDNLVGKFAYSQLPLKEIGPFKGDCSTNYVFSVRDCLKESCVTRAELGKVCCNSSGDCQLSGFKIEKTGCNDQQEFYVVLNFTHTNTSDCFTVQGNGKVYGTFNYSQLPIKLGPLKADCSTNYEFVIRDCKNEKCALEGQLGKVCCESKEECMLSDLTLTRTECSGDGTFYVKINFKYKNVSECFVVRQGNTIVGKFKYASLPIQIGPFKGNCITNYNFTITDCVKESCRLKKSLGKVCCTATNNCMLGDLKIEKTGCDDNKNFFVFINFKFKNQSECFTIQGNGVKYGTYKYASLPIIIGPLKGNCETSYEFLVRDCKNENCTTSANIGKVCCEVPPSLDCKIYDLGVKTIECTGPQQYAIQLNFKSQGTKGVGFDVFDQTGSSLGFYSYQQLPLVIKEFKSLGTSSDYLKVCENDNNKCCAELKFDALKCIGSTHGNSFNLSDVKVLQGNQYISIHSDFIFPEGFKYFVYDMTGRELKITEASRTEQDIILEVSQVPGGIFIIRTENKYESRNLKMVR
ncbi:MAG TPA: hypothetical protein PKK64_08575 [Saprospiraceae bacterium]|nr:hypothetical protein [Saprospiraceae bacterium]HMZ39678.1 hypothetical protein [Saprospiraceae bacterium]HNB30204.1 hypothetical protein [Saprospiraceae bacterium]HNC36286.1 hypothetical protein [Saprospiraceae bacterium]HNE62238.1 hypothetical protein [Saprospiraceae bacterium]